MNRWEARCLHLPNPYRSPDPAQLISQLCDEIGFEKLINEQLDWDISHCKLSPVQRLKAFIINILCDRRPLYIASLFAPDVQADDLNDNSLARGLASFLSSGTMESLF